MTQNEKNTVHCKTPLISVYNLIIITIQITTMKHSACEHSQLATSLQLLTVLALAIENS